MLSTCSCIRMIMFHLLSLSQLLVPCQFSLLAVLYNIDLKSACSWQKLQKWVKGSQSITYFWSVCTIFFLKLVAQIIPFVSWARLLSIAVSQYQFHNAEARDKLVCLGNRHCYPFTFPFKYCCKIREEEGCFKNTV